MRRQRKKYFNSYQAYRGKSQWKKITLWVIIAAAAVLLAALAVWLLMGGNWNTLPFFGK